jgi:hypothetical protein
MTKKTYARLSAACPGSREHVGRPGETIEPLAAMVEQVAHAQLEIPAGISFPLG